MKKGLRCGAWFCALALTFSLAAGAAYTDLDPKAWYYGAVQKSIDSGLMMGTDTTHFSPMAPVSRATVLTVLWRLEGSPAAVADPGFTDVADGAWYYAPAAWAKEAGIAAGYKDGSFAPEGNVTREQLAVFLCRYAEYQRQPPAKGVLEVYPDAAAVSGWAADGMRHALGMGLITGNGRGELDPAGVATRAALAVIVGRLTVTAQG
ncbi:MAG: S-layer homology domain-containing protein [Pseudoflavonifractor sp.]